MISSSIQISLFEYPWPNLLVVRHFSSSKFNCSNLIVVHSDSSHSESFKILSNGISIYKGVIAFTPYTKAYGVAPMEVQTVVR